MIILFVSAAMAAGIHTGIPVNGAVEGIGPPAFQTAETGWSATLPDGGIARIYVGTDEAAASTWLAQMQVGVQVTLPPLADLGDEAVGDGAGMALTRDGNVGVMVQGTNDALDWAAQLLGAIVDDFQAAAWPAPPALQEDGERWAVDAPGAAQVTFQGGRLARHAGLVFVQPPTRLVGWDAYGRPAAQDFVEGVAAPAAD
jgi:hypothetical protein